MITLLKKENMNATEIEKVKSVKICDLLSARGITPVSEPKNGKAWFVSPLRSKEKTPSFVVDLDQNRWKDFGENSGGSTIDLLMKMENVSFRDAVKIIAHRVSYSHSFSFHKPVTKKIPSGKIEIKHVQNLQTRPLIDYLLSRGINIDLAAKYCQEAFFELHGKRYFAICFQNDQGGFELRNGGFKGGSSPKAITTIIALDQAGFPKSNTLNVFEGFFDFLSLLTYYDQIKLKNTTIILNSLSFVDRILPEILFYKNVNLFLDNDSAGQKATKKIKAIKPNAINFAEKLYPGHKDFNDFLMKTSKTKEI